MLSNQQVQAIHDSLSESKKSKKSSKEEIQIKLICTKHNQDAMDFASEMGVTLPNSLIMKTAKRGNIQFGDQDGTDGIIVNGEYIECPITDHGITSISSEKKFRNSKFSLKTTKNVRCFDIQLPSGYFILLSPLCNLESTDLKLRTVLNQLPFIQQIVFEYSSGGSARTAVIDAELPELVESQ